jgi:rhodanese-related sulfurtransferase
MDANIPSITTAQLQCALQSPLPPLVIDIRRGPAFAESSHIITGALHRDPTQLPDWAASLPSGHRVVVYCVHGHQVSQGAAQALCARGIRAQYLEGGISHWVENGGTVTHKPAGLQSL